jgi:predicted transcriptional regulator
MLGGLAMDVTMPVVETPELLEKLDKGIDDMENGRVTPHEETMRILMQRYNDHVSQNS